MFNSLNSSHVDMTMSAVSSTRNAKASQDLTKLETASNASETELLSAAWDPKRCQSAQIFLLHSISNLFLKVQQLL